MPIQIINSALTRTIANGGRQITLKFANETEAWRRTFLSQEMRDGFAKAMEKADIPPRATVAIMAETEHPSQKDSYPHYTVVYQDDQGNHVTTKHVYP
ncbi:hypothetical protein K431DRAFT_216969 [Polychaeton citri CBS 116435]|uniref:Uncharacterized protein n=1 Tax=Polychaeton citri CBS 116435 TaxID=1314669 RepID=A0A9P4QH18_9PEZI|nr:hypothetical protein K431DRAFT_216969 [Polychaeton citri CBS 116435]